MPIIRSADRAVELRGGALPTLQRLVDRSVGSEAFTVLVNVASAGQAVQAHVHDVEEVLIVVDGEISAPVDCVGTTAAAGDIVRVPPGTEHTFQPSRPAFRPGTRDRRARISRRPNRAPNRRL
jgi:quercetin dioxygenase-like cupin family protein